MPAVETSSICNTCVCGRGPSYLQLPISQCSHRALQSRAAEALAGLRRAAAVHKALERLACRRGVRRVTGRMICRWARVAVGTGPRRRRLALLASRVAAEFPAAAAAGRLRHCWRRWLSWRMVFALPVRLVAEAAAEAAEAAVVDTLERVATRQRWVSERRRVARRLWDSFHDWQAEVDRAGSLWRAERARARIERLVEAAARRRRLKITGRAWVCWAAATWASRENYAVGREHDATAAGQATVLAAAAAAVRLRVRAAEVSLRRCVSELVGRCLRRWRATSAGRRGRRQLLVLQWQRQLTARQRRGFRRWHQVVAAKLDLTRRCLRLKYTQHQRRLSIWLWHWREMTRSEEVAQLGGSTTPQVPEEIEVARKARARETLARRGRDDSAVFTKPIQLPSAETTPHCLVGSEAPSPAAAPAPVSRVRRPGILADVTNSPAAVVGGRLAGVRDFQAKRLRAKAAAGGSTAARMTAQNKQHQHQQQHQHQRQQHAQYLKHRGGADIADTFMLDTMRVGTPSSTASPAFDGRSLTTMLRKDAAAAPTKNTGATKNHYQRVIGQHLFQ